MTGSRWKAYNRPRTPTQTRRGTIAPVASRSTEDQHLRDLARLRRVRDRIDREYDRPLDVEALARDANISAGHLTRQFKIAYGESPYSYLMTRRIERAMALLRRGDLSVTEVCFAVGCSSLGTFSTRFCELVGVPPSAYRDQTARHRSRPSVMPGEAGDQTDQESRSSWRRASPNVTVMDITIHSSVLPHDDPKSRWPSTATPSASRCGWMSARARCGGSPSARRISLARQLF